jgi:hypothetical protein
MWPLHRLSPKDIMIFAKRLATDGRTRLFTIEHHAASGWIAREQDDRATRTSMIRDWRHVEATMALFELKASALRSEGWLEVSPTA